MASGARVVLNASTKSDKRNFNEREHAGVAGLATAILLLLQENFPQTLMLILSRRLSQFITQYNKPILQWPAVRLYLLCELPYIIRERTQLRWLQCWSQSNLR